MSLKVPLNNLSDVLKEKIEKDLQIKIESKTFSSFNNSNVKYLYPYDLQDGIVSVPFFYGINMEDVQSKEDVFEGAVKALEDQDIEKAFTLFSYFIENFNDSDKKAISYFWLGEISFIQNNLDASQNFFMELILSYPEHYRVPLAHKKMGDIFLKKNELTKAKEKYNFVVREYPNDTASSLALQLLKNME